MDFERTGKTDLVAYGELVSNDSNMLPLTLSRLPGETLDGLFRLDEVVGVGGMGVVFKGQQLGVERTVAVKVLDPGFADTEAYTQRFRREAQSIARLDHVNCLQLYEYGTTDDNLHYIVMPLLRGRPLDELVERGQTVAARCAMRILEQVLAGLHHAHERGLIHRDLKPSNLLVEQRGSRFGEGDLVRIVDFGIAKIVDDDAPFHSRVGMFFGTPAYMSPEQALGEQLDARSDLFAAGLVAYRLLTGTVPHRGRTALDQLQRRATLGVPNLPATFPTSVIDIIAKLCARDPQERYADAGTARAAVRRALQDAPPSHDRGWDEPAPRTMDTAPAESSARVVTLELSGGHSKGGVGWPDDVTLNFDTGEFPPEFSPAVTAARHETTDRTSHSPSRVAWARQWLPSVIAFAGLSLTTLSGQAACGASDHEVATVSAGLEAPACPPMPLEPAARLHGEMCSSAMGHVPAKSP